MQYFYTPNFNPIIFKIGLVSLHWYGMMYILGFLFAIWLLTHPRYPLNIFFNDRKDIEYLLFLNFLGVIIGGRVGYALFYQWPFFYCQDILWILKIWEGGMSFHGGLLGVIISIKWFSYRKNQSFLKVSDFVVPAVPFGLGLGRLGNFINGELWGRVTFDVPWAMLFYNSFYQDLLVLETYPELEPLFNYYGALPRHPSQLYEMILEGIVLFILIYLFIYKPKPVGSISGLFLVLYGLFRLIAEFFRQPDNHIGLINHFFTLGQILSLPMIVSGGIIILCAYKKKLLSKITLFKKM
ncbi:prolipoprotein diacylglyceryl transferase [Candidatus Blochmanniella vafra str. BVAF]|uniref:Phosphatidylglycerol--prolipoprotein diacylglyceryl transferase n=1 Tax=Blochmanniella vafra (strain BVAF) TaxID=859654 RepID=E8Q650_BLOVB|nr:prolipoprotein diacylglyceryl transferase [Candidatus Blochmannia vafer]ADV33666.1 prolipoprotein diacylglyceryl transferase [Candidatus Blochmannia vafer str. BVAF]